MARYRGNSHVEKVVLRLLLCLWLASLTGCVNLSTTTFVKVSPSKIVEPTPRTLELMAASCLSAVRFERLLDQDEEFAALKANYGEAVRPTLRKILADVFADEGVECPQSAANYWKAIRDGLKKDNQGLIDDQDTGHELEAALRSAVGQAEQVSISTSAPGALSLSVRPMPSDQEPGAVFSALKERAQAAIIEYAQDYARRSGKVLEKDTGPEVAANSLLKALSASPSPRLLETQKVEFNISAAVNSASVDDRFEYITAYLKVPALPGRLNGRISLERVLLSRLQGLLFARPEYQRRPCDAANKLLRAEISCTDEVFWELSLKSDLRRAIDRIRVRIEIIDQIETKAATIELGKITSQAGVTLDATQSVVANLALTKATPNISASREDSLKRELDRRTAWISPERSLLRITQRGIREATISGTIANALTLRIPKTDLYLLSVYEEAPPKVKPETTTAEQAAPRAGAVAEETKVKKVKLQNIEQPLYGTVDALGVALGAVRVAIPSGYPFRRELDGLSTAVIGEPVALRLWRNDRTVQTLDFQDLSPGLRGTPEGLRALGVHSVLFSMSQFAVFSSIEQWGGFVKALAEGQLRLRSYPKKAGWLLIGGKDICKETLAKAGTDEILLGIETEDGSIRGFEKHESEQLAPFIAKC